MLSWFDKSPELHWWSICAVTAPILLVLFRPLLRPGWRESQGSDWRWSVVIFLLLLAGRWPTWLVTRQFNDDESFMIAGATTLRHDALFFRSVDGGTAGPLDYYALLPVGSLLGVDDYASARITALLLLGAALSFTHQSLACIFGRQTARIATFGATCVEAFTLSPDLLHYSTELVAAFLTAIAVWAISRRTYSGASWRWNLLGGLALGAIPFAKLQAAPAAVFIGGLCLVTEIWPRGRSLVAKAKGAYILLIASFIPLTLVVSTLAFNGYVGYAATSYILGNIDYTGSVFPLQPDLTALQTLSYFLQLASRPAYLLGYWALGCLFWTAAILAIYRPLRNSNYHAVTFGFGLLLLSVASVAITHRPFLHYGHFLVIPITLLVGSMLGITIAANQAERRRSFAICALLICTVGPSMWSRSGSMFPYLGILQRLQEHRLGAVSYEISKYAQAGEPLGLWGWMSRLYVEGGFRQATRYANSMGAIQQGRFQALYRRCYLEDFRRTAPPCLSTPWGWKTSMSPIAEMLMTRAFPLSRKSFALNILSSRKDKAHASTSAMIV